MLSFKLLEQYLNNTNINLVITKNGEEVTVSLLPQPKIKDEAKSNLKPILLRGTAEELDEQFHTLISKPMDKVTGIVSNIQEFEDSADKLATKSKAAEELKKQSTKNKEKAESLLKEADVFVKDKDYSKAILKIEAALKFIPDFDKAIKLLAEVKELDTPDLFAEVEEVKTEKEVIIPTNKSNPLPVNDAFANPVILGAESKEELEEVREALKVLEQPQEEVKKSLFDTIEQTRANIDIISSPKPKETEQEYEDKATLAVVSAEEIDALYSESDEMEDSMKPNEDAFNNEGNVINDDLF